MPNVPNQTSDPDTSDVKYFKTRKHGMKVIIGDPDPRKGEVAPKTLAFVPYFIEEKGVAGKQKIGFLATDHGTAIKKLSNDYEVTSIKKAEYEAATKEEFDDAGNQLSGFRAPY